MFTISKLLWYMEEKQFISVLVIEESVEPQRWLYIEWKTCTYKDIAAFVKEARDAVRMNGFHLVAFCHTFVCPRNLNEKLWS